MTGDMLMMGIPVELVPHICDAIDRFVEMPNINDFQDEEEIKQALSNLAEQTRKVVDDYNRSQKGGTPEVSETV